MKDKGFTLLELLLVIGITTTMSIVSFQEKILETEQSQARRLGMELFQYNSAVQNYIAHMSGNSDSSFVTQNKTGINWLKSKRCAFDDQGPNEKDWLSCNFLRGRGEKTTFGGLSFSTEISYERDSQALIARTVMSKLETGINGEKQERADLAGLAALIASGAYSISEQTKAAAAQDVSVAFCPDTQEAVDASSVCKGDKGVIVMLSRNLSAADRWLRVDHGNVMSDTIEFRTGDPTPSKKSDMEQIDSISRQIRNVARIYNLGDKNDNSGRENLFLGRRFGESAKSMVTLPDDAVVIDADQEVLGQLKVALSIESKGNITSEKDILAKGTLTSQGDTRVGQNLHVSGNANINNKLNVNGDTYIDKNLLVSGSITAQDNIKTNKDLIANQNLTVSGVGRINSSLITPILIDSNDSNYYVDPNGQSRISRLRVEADTYTVGTTTSNGRLIANEYMLVKKSAIPGSSCDEAGMIGQSSQDQSLVVCQNKIWVSQSQSGQYAFFNSQHCPAGWTPADGSRGTVDTRGLFIRSLDNGRGMDPGRALGSYQKGTLVGGYDDNYVDNFDFSIIQGNAANYGGDAPNMGEYPYQGNAWRWRSGNESNLQKYPDSHASAWLNVTRPKNIALLACMRI